MRRCLTLPAVLCLLGLSLLMLSGFTWAAAQSQTVLRIVPQTLKIRVGEVATVDLTVEQVSDLFGAQVHLTFDPAVLEVVDADTSEEGIQIEPGTLPTPDFVVQNVANNQAGTIDYALTQLKPSEPRSGDGLLARVTFRGKKAASTQILLEQFMLADVEGKAIEALPQNAQVRVMNRSTWIMIGVAGAAVLLLAGGGIGFAIRRK
ncbi:MAG: cohesin domain-containing protein [Anaerolineae bacterium]|jgi:hypothetical protein